jgi:hypothetical protein
MGILSDRMNDMEARIKKLKKRMTEDTLAGIAVIWRGTNPAPLSRCSASLQLNSASEEAVRPLNSLSLENLEVVRRKFLYHVLRLNHDSQSAQISHKGCPLRRG